MMRCGWMVTAGMLLAAMVQAQPGYPDRSPGLDVLPGFRNPPPGYGEVSFYWWLGDPLDRERLRWQLDQLQGSSVSALQVNYAHSDQGGRSWGLTYESQPKLFSEPWWDLFGWFVKQARQRGMAVSLSDYTLGWPGQGWYFDEILRAVPEARGARLVSVEKPCAGGAECVWTLPAAQTLMIAAYGPGGRMVDLRAQVSGGTLRWRAPAGAWRVVAVQVEEKPVSLNPMHPESGKQLIARFFQRFEDRNPGESGRGLNFFFSDELGFGVRGWLWDRYFADEFRKRKGYDVVPELAALFVDAGPRTVKVRLDYSDVMVSLEEEHFFRPLFEWHHSRGMMFGCDHGGRGKDITEFGDYFRTQRWMTGPGNDQPNLTSDVIKNKVASSIAHLYERPRTWLEGYYGSGWGTTGADVVDATWRNFAMGHNLLTLHGLYYSTHGGWWEWAPPCNHFRMPYWPHLKEFLRASERASYLLSQGRHRADVAIVYPVAAVEAGSVGKKSVQAAFALGTWLYEHGVDFDFVDFESLARARVDGRALQVAGESYRVLVVPSMKAVRFSTMEKAREFHRGGGLVLAPGDLPVASERVGSGDAQLEAMVRETFRAPQPQTPAEVQAAIERAVPRDIACDVAGKVLHRKAGARDIYMVYGVPKGTVCRFRAEGRAELWDLWSGSTRVQPVLEQGGGFTRVRMPLEATEAQLIVFAPGAAVRERGRPAVERAVAIEGPWEFELKPTLDNRWGDFRLPASNTMIGAEARRFRYFDGNGPARPVTYTYGPRFWKLGPVTTDAEAVERKAAVLAGVADGDAVGTYKWQPLEYSLRWGIEDDAGHQGYHGLKGETPGSLIGLGKKKYAATRTVYEEEAGGGRYFLWTTVLAPRAMTAHTVVDGAKPAAMWLNGVPLPGVPAEVPLHAGANVLLLRYDGAGQGVFLLDENGGAGKWFEHKSALVFDPQPLVKQPVGWYRLTAPPGLRAFTMKIRGKAQAFVNNVPVPLTATADGRLRGAVKQASAEPVTMAIRVEQERGVYGGAAIIEPVEFECGAGQMNAGDWAEIDGLSSYSGGAWYRKTVRVEAGQRVWLDLGDVAASAEVLVNGRRAGVRVAPPWKVEITDLVRAGENRLEVLVYNTLANHYQTIPTRYRGSARSGLLGPVRLLLSPAASSQE